MQQGPPRGKEPLPSELGPAETERELARRLSEVPQLGFVHAAFAGEVSFDDYYRGQKLTMNPSVSVTEIRKDGRDLGLVLAVPMPGKGIQLLPITDKEHPALYRRLRSAFLLAPGEAAARPVRYRCFLDDPPTALVPATSAEPSPASLMIVNPRLHFQQSEFDAHFPSSVASRIPFWNQRCIEPGYAQLWLEDPGTGVLGAFWVRGPWIPLVASLTPGAAPPAMDAESARLLARASVLVPADYVERRRDEWQRICDAAQVEVRERGYAILRQVFHPFQIAALRRYYRELIDEGHLLLGDPQVPRRYFAHNEDMARFLHGQLTALLTRIVGEPRKPSYCYLASYQPGAVLRRHTDKLQCEVSATFLVDYEPEGASWPLYLVINDQPVAIELSPGDALLYKGAEIPHYREALPVGHRSTSIFFHWVPVDYQGPLD